MSPLQLFNKLRERESKLGPQEVFVLLWSYVAAVGLTEPENRLRAESVHPLQLQPDSSHLNLSEAAILQNIEDLQKNVRDAAPFGIAVLKWLKGIDQALKDVSMTHFDGLELPGLENDLYFLCRRNDFIADYYEQRHDSVTWAKNQGLSLAAYARYHVAIRCTAQGGLRIQYKNAWSGEYLQDRLLHDRHQFSVLIWPIESKVAYGPKARPENGSAFVSLCQIENEAEIGVEIDRALSLAATNKNTLLLLPELSVSPMLEERVRGFMTAAGPDGYPILAAFGRCHCNDPESGNDLNEAVLIAAGGITVHTHRKLTPFSLGKDYPVGERIETGDVLEVLPSDAGNLAVLICLDLFHPTVQPLVVQSQANLLVVPSLSPKTSAHRYASTSLQATNHASTFVANRWFMEQEKPAEGTSFFRVPRAIEPEEPHWKPEFNKPAESYLLFRLTNE